jgi:hypothetical protein
MFGFFKEHIIISLSSSSSAQSECTKFWFHGMQLVSLAICGYLLVSERFW